MRVGQPDRADRDGAFAAFGGGRPRDGAPGVAQGGQDEEAVGVDLDVLANGEDAQRGGGFGQDGLAEPGPLGAGDPEVLAVAADNEGGGAAVRGIGPENSVDGPGEADVADCVRGGVLRFLAEPEARYRSRAGSVNGAPADGSQVNSAS